MPIPRTWKVCQHVQILQEYDKLWDEIAARAEAVGCQRVNKPALYIFKATTGLGQCRSKMNTRTKEVISEGIGLNKIFLQHADKATTVLIHEIAHAFRPDDQHGPTWESIGRPIAKKYGVQFARMTDLKKLGIDEEELKNGKITDRKKA